VVTADGRSLKVRYYARPTKVREAAALRVGLADDRLPKILLVSGRVVVEEWIDGVSLQHLPLSESRLSQAADLLGALHATRAVGRLRLPVSRRVRPLLRRADRQLAHLVAAGAVRAAERDIIARSLARFAPEDAWAGVTHDDFCAENLVENPFGRVLAVDNEHMGIGFLEFDLARTWYRWPMSVEAWERFQDRYSSWRGPVDGENAPFWRLAAVLSGAYVRLVRLGGARIEAPLGKLRELITGLA
jgi:aminoglycoside phosphotransferase (APT) family kinase protein